MCGAWRGICTCTFIQKWLWSELTRPAKRPPSLISRSLSTMNMLQLRNNEMQCSLGYAHLVICRNHWPYHDYNFIQIYLQLPRSLWKNYICWDNCSYKNHPKICIFVYTKALFFFFFFFLARDRTTNTEVARKSKRWMLTISCDLSHTR